MHNLTVRFRYRPRNTMSPQTIIIIADYGVGDPAFTEVILQLQNSLPDTHIYPLSTPPFSTVNTGFWIYQIAQTPNLKNTFIYSNTAPRQETKKAQKDNSGEKLMYAKLKNGFEIFAVNAGHVFSFVKEEIADFHLVNVDNAGSQFRSRDNYPQTVIQMIQGGKTFLGEKIAPMVIPNPPTHVVASIDGYGNIKTTIRMSQIKLKPGTRVTIAIRNNRHVATYTDGVFNIKDGELAFAPGSSGHKDKFMEIFVRGGNVYKLFEKPSVEEEIEITTL